MITNLLIPKGGMGTSEGTIAEWLKKEGDAVSRGDIVVAIETAKVLEELESPVDGVLKKILLEEGETAEVHTIIAEIEHD